MQNHLNAMHCGIYWTIYSASMHFTFSEIFCEISEELDLEYIHTDDLKKWQTPCMAH